MANKIWNKDEIICLLETNNKMVERSLLKLYERQTITERNCHSTIDNNGMGFNAPDAKILTSICESYLEYGRLTEKQIALVRKKLLKYAGQLTLIANNK